MRIWAPTPVQTFNIFFEMLFSNRMKVLLPIHAPSERFQVKCFLINGLQDMGEKAGKQNHAI